MFRFTVICILFSSSYCSTFAAYISADLEGRIVGGVETTIEQHPYQVSIQTISGDHFCGGSLINEYIVVTGAHCLQNFAASQMRIRAGSTNNKLGGQLINVASLKYHPEYNPTTVEYDVGILKLKNPARISAGINFIELAKVTPPTGTPSVVTGWGVKCSPYCQIPPTTLQAVEVNIVQRKDCTSDTYKYGDAVKETMICAYALRKDACQGDSGGPLVAGGKLVGVISWGYGCAQKGYPGVYSEVAALRNWVLEASAEI